ncbi:MAG: hypothetical protein ABIJ43_03095 [Candidatus Beckwithbacteria bacterium]|nr:type II toxin-antitoxin system Phd/YefM family antitoxin [Patescibacteria group bacterium]
MLNLQSYSIRETREQLSRLVELAELTGEKFLVTKFGKPKAAIMPVPQSWLKKRNVILDYVGFMGLTGESGVELEDRVRRNKKERDYIKTLRAKK